MLHPKWRIGAAALLFIGLTGCGSAGNTEGNRSAGTAAGKPQWSQPPAMQIDPAKQYDAVFHTNYGDFTVSLFAKESPRTVNNFVFLCEHHFYDNDKFFRIIQPFMIQTGDPLNNGTGGPGYQFADELPPKHSYTPGIVAMANAGPNTNGSQFFICTGPDAKALDQNPNYTQFGQVTSGMDVVQKIAAIPVTNNPMTGERSFPTKDAVIKTIDIQVH
ncbi:MAG: peptidylprolyl isomerase [Alicyclobacillus macrosporangiidus]|uniref:peptidylprolyl isomerase n=1 Tax=Alicyclobacillus macrosporangiidus TaxID=392015 RepID=UPI0026EC71F5|nr:peptidylprolyl isomerase [Alicyclobacillus macrosporangiidus]MCL6598307.1 peptidylprolyl isomerase [Alicyclobacillus macrosporangiidus]